MKAIIWGEYSLFALAALSVGANFLYLPSLTFFNFLNYAKNIRPPYQVLRLVVW